MDHPDTVLVVAPPALRERVRAALEAAGIGVVFVDEEESGPGETLTARELDVLAALAEGLGNRGIAGRLGISEHTVKFHLASIYGKLGTTTRAATLRRAFRRGLITM